MAKKTKELEEIDVKQIKKKSVAKKSTSKKETPTTKKQSTKNGTIAKKETTATKKASSKKPSASKKTTTISKSEVAKKASKTKKTTTKKSTTKKRTTSAKKVASEVSFKSEYYDLPYMYNKTVVKVLAQTPKMLFIYWEISDDDRISLEKKYGEDFFEKTRPVLIVYNDTMHYSFEVDINDFANSWYLHIKDANCEYHVELGRRPYPYNYPQANSEPVYIPYYIYLTSSNEMTSPNNKILFEFNKTVRFRNVKTGQVIERDISEFKYITNFGIFSLQDLYKFLFPGESFEYENIALGNTSSGALSSSGMFSSQFK